MSNNWIDKPFAILSHVQGEQYLGATPQEVAAVKRGMGFDAEHWLGSVVKTGGSNSQQWLFKTRHGYIRDDLTSYLPAAKEQGLKVLIYINAHWFDHAQLPQEFFARKADGSFFTAYGSGSLTCPAGAFLDYSVELAEDLSQYPIDGVFLDGPYGAVCWCEHCRRTYRQRFGSDIPEKPDFKQRRLMEQWAAEKVATYVDKFRQAIRVRRPDAVLYHNGAILGQLSWSNSETIKHEDILGAEGGFIGYTSLTGQFLYKTAATGKMLAGTAGGKPAVIFSDTTFKMFDNSLLPRPELDILYGATIATGANPWIYYPGLDTHATEACRYWNGFIAKNREVLSDVKPAERVGLLWSDDSMLVSQTAKDVVDDVHLQSESTGEISEIYQVNHKLAVEGAYALLSRSEIPFKIVSERNLQQELATLDVLVCAGAVSLSEPAFEAIRQFVLGGGILIADSQFAAVDELGGKRPAQLIKQVLGAAVKEAIPFVLKNIDYIERGYNWLFEGISKSPLPRPSQAFRLDMDGAKAIAHFLEPLKGRYDYLTPASSNPAVTEYKAGKGRAFYMPMALFEHYQDFNFDEQRQMVANIIRRGCKIGVEVIGLQGRGEVMVASGKGKMLVHLMNYNGTVRPFAQIFPVKGLKIRLRGMNPAKAIALHAQQDLKIRQGQAGCTITLPQLQVAETVYIELP